MFVAERLEAEVRAYRDGQLLPEPRLTVPVVRAGGNDGLLGLALHPEFTNGSPYVYVYFTGKVEGRTGVFNRLSRYRLTDGVFGKAEHVLERITSSGAHNGGAIAFGPDGKLYALVGDESVGSQSQDLSFLSGKVLRLNADGSIPSDNPFPGSLVYSLGHRNMIGIGFDPRTGTAVITENSDQRDDEVNVLVPGANYGWPVVAGVEGDRRFVDPLLTFTPNIAPTGATFYTGDNLPTYYDGGFFFGDYNLGGLHFVKFADDLTKVAQHEVALRSGLGILSVANGPDGHLYFNTRETIYKVVAEGGE